MIPAKKTSNKPPTKRRFKCPPLHRAVTRFGEGRGLTPIKPPAPAPAPAPAKAAPAAKPAAASEHLQALTRGLQALAHMNRVGVATLK